MGIHVIIAEEKLLMEGRTINQESIQSTAIKYIHEYVNCKVCNGHNTKLIKNPDTRIFQISCVACQSTRAVVNIKSATSVNTGRKK